jgi:hypothetical protein
LDEDRPGAGLKGAGLELVHAAGLTELVRRATEQAVDELGAERVLPVLSELRALLPGGGLRQGATIAVDARLDHAGRPMESVGATSLLLALLAAASRAGSWCAVVGVPTLGAAAAVELGVALDRLALVPAPGPDWAAVVAALLDGLDIVVAAAPGPVAASVSSRLSARARHRGSVLVPYGHWEGADLTLDATHGVWHGLGQGRGRLRCRQLTITARGRGAATVPRRVDVWLPKLSGPLRMVGSGAADAEAPPPTLTLVPETPGLPAETPGLPAETPGLPAAGTG